MMSLERIQDQIGYLVLNEDGAVIASGGELENNEHVADVVTGLISLADNIQPDEEGYKKISVTYENFSYVICLSNKKVYVVKKRHSWSPPPPPDNMANIGNLVDLDNGPAIA
ncbi:ragulator complex protein LAMTOR4-like [Macrosteles quadrilineatus]|uniref:ragulator complex protein LAMTOR4-like n=1 Tax=Macrosteles quadrilineatus TaxID=74068 RepID=UPI0023E34EBC|nr:ragulator complex protein LAMTOR4-like [Macrosteles quadrilineatus]XP_054273057.1 ragulator complex protein LAMTOR4-like [Macrosteles quadrilineatus]XP_054273284.1 ragulator complex protein LAMTOR4-like [Macrosteles quadrilineatus]